LWNPIAWADAAFTKLVNDRIGRAVQQALPQAPPKGTTQPDPLYHLTGYRAYRQIVIDNDIISARKDCLEMYFNDGDLAAQMDGIGIDACATDNEGLPFQIVPLRQADKPATRDERGRRAPTPEQQAITEVYDRIDATLHRIGLYDKVAHSSTWGPLLGEYHDEVVWDLRTGDALRLDRIQTVRENAVMRKLRDPATNAHVGWRLVDLDTSEKLRDFRLWEVMHYEWNNNIPLLTPARIQWRMLRENEEDLYAGRKSRAFAKMVKIYKDASPEQIREWQAQENREKRDLPPGPDTDLITNSDVKLLDPANQQLSKIDDLRYRRRQVQSAGRKPIGLLAAYGDDINRATLDKQDDGYIRLLTRVNAMANRPIAQLINVQLVLWGYDPMDYPFQIKWTEKNTRDFSAMVQALQILEKFGLSWQTILSEAGYDYEEELDRREYEAEVEPDRGDDVIDRMIAEIGRRNSQDPTKGRASAPETNGAGRLERVGS
jgi:hypothetical protein